MGKKISGAQKRKKRKEKEKAVKKAVADMERLKAWTDQDMDGIVVASQGCVCIACAFEIEYDGSVFLFTGEYRESRCA